MRQHASRDREKNVKKNIASAGNRTRIACLEGKHAATIPLTPNQSLMSGTQVYER